MSSVDAAVTDSLAHGGAEEVGISLLFGHFPLYTILCVKTRVFSAEMPSDDKWDCVNFQQRHVQITPLITKGCFKNVYKISLKLSSLL